MSKSFYGSICHTDYMESVKSGKFKGVKSEKNGKIYVNVKVWVNDEPDQFGNSATIQLAKKDEFKDEKVNSYIGNLKESERKEPEEITEKDFLDDDDLDLPF